MSPKLSYIKTYLREANLRLYYVIFSWLGCLFCCYLKSSQIIYLIIKPTLNKSGAVFPSQPVAPAESLNHLKNGVTSLSSMLSEPFNLFVTPRTFSAYDESTRNLDQPDKSLFSYETRVERLVSKVKHKQPFAELDKLSPQDTGGQPLPDDRTAETSPYKSEICHPDGTYDFIYTNVTEAFYATLETAIIFSIVFTLPVLIYQLWSFLMPSRYHRERIHFNKVSLQLLLYVTFFLWLIIWCLLPHICQFLHLFAVQRGVLRITNQARIAPYLSWVFTTVLTLFMASCTPVYIYFSLKKGWLSKNFLIENRRTMAYLLIIFAALISPPDLWSQLIISLCLFVFLECVIWLYLYKTKD